MSGRDLAALRILHVIRAPLGGLFRHVLDLANEQIARGHSVGLIADSLTGGAWADETFRELEPRLALGLSRTPMRRNLHPADVFAFAHVAERIRRTRPDIVHGHGSKGGAFARLAATRGPNGQRTAYTPHGGSFNYCPGTAAHALYMAAERLLAKRTDVFLFESAFIRARFHAWATPQQFCERVVLNGIGPDEFEPVAAAADAADFLYVGELRSAKGIDTLLEALAASARRLGRTPTAALVGSGPDEGQLVEHTHRLGLAAAVKFHGRLPARTAFTLGRTLVIPSRAESLPYVVLEAAGAHIPMIATDVGGIPEIFGPYADRLIPCDDVGALTSQMMEALTAPRATLIRRADQVAEFVGCRFSIRAMVDSVSAGYRDALSQRKVVRDELPEDPARVSSRVRGH
jgi:glycosyltransferase involved in cell wall biosynthesis